MHVCLLVAAKVLLDLSTTKSRRSIKNFSGPESHGAYNMTSPLKAPKQAAKSVLVESQHQLTPVLPPPAESKTTLQGTPIRKTLTCSTLFVQFVRYGALVRGGGGSFVAIACRGDTGRKVERN